MTNIKFLSSCHQFLRVKLLFQACYIAIALHFVSLGILTSTWEFLERKKARVEALVSALSVCTGQAVGSGSHAVSHTAGYSAGTIECVRAGCS